MTVEQAQESMFSRCYHVRVLSWLILKATASNQKKNQTGGFQAGL